MAEAQAAAVRYTLAPQYRLLRHDFVGPLLEAVDAGQREVRTRQHVRHGPTVYRDVRVEHFSRRGPALMVSVKLPQGHRALRFTKRKDLKTF